jgi:hypothetical protein
LLTLTAAVSSAFAYLGFNRTYVILSAQLSFPSRPQSLRR